VSTADELCRGRSSQGHPSPARPPPRRYHRAELEADADQLRTDLGVSGEAATAATPAARKHDAGSVTRSTAHGRAEHVDRKSTRLNSSHR